MCLGKPKITPHKGNIFQQELELKAKAKELSKNRKEVKPIKYILKR